MHIFIERIHLHHQVSMMLEATLEMKATLRCHKITKVYQLSPGSYLKFLSDVIFWIWQFWQLRLHLESLIFLENGEKQNIQLDGIQHCNLKSLYDKVFMWQKFPLRYWLRSEIKCFYNLTNWPLCFYLYVGFPGILNVVVKLVDVKVCLKMESIRR